MTNPTPDPDAAAREAFRAWWNEHVASDEWDESHRCADAESAYLAATRAASARIEALESEVARLTRERDEAVEGWARRYAAIRRAAQCDERTHHEDLVAQVRAMAVAYRRQITVDPPRTDPHTPARDRVVEAAMNRWRYETGQPYLAVPGSINGDLDQACAALDALQRPVVDPALTETQMIRAWAKKLPDSEWMARDALLIHAEAIDTALRQRADGKDAPNGK